LKGPGNQLVISNGANVFAGNVFQQQQHGSEPTASNNAALVTGNNSSWRILGN